MKIFIGLKDKRYIIYWEKLFVLYILGRGLIDT